MIKLQNLFKIGGVVFTSYLIYRASYSGGKLTKYYNNNNSLE